MSKEHPNTGAKAAVPVATFVGLPSEVVNGIADYLSMRCLKSFRFASIWIADAARAYAHVTLLLSRQACRDFVPETIASDQRVFCIRKLHIIFRSEEPTDIAIGSLLAKLPNLRHLELSRLSSVAMQSQFNLAPIQGAVASRALTLESLSLSHCSLKAEELIACVRAFSPTLRSLKLDHLLITTADWRTVLRDIGLLPLKQLSWYSLLLNPAGAMAKLIFDPDRDRYEKFYLTTEGYEILVAQETNLMAKRQQGRQPRDGVGVGKAELLKDSTRSEAKDV
ncbi:hypothetical protein LTR27_005523 [Elasticomyces elasticus]|nr:hypothetical protein LTR27_005523 [Elasticomyces elasticus]